VLAGSPLVLVALVEVEALLALALKLVQLELLIKGLRAVALEIILVLVEVALVKLVIRTATVLVVTEYHPRLLEQQS
jgi:hypothetical protein